MWETTQTTQNQLSVNPFSKGQSINIYSSYEKNGLQNKSDARFITGDMSIEKVMSQSQITTFRNDALAILSKPVKSEISNYNSGIIKNIFNTIRESNLARIDSNSIEELERFLSNVVSKENYNPFTLIVSLENTHKYLEKVLSDARNVKLEIELFKDDEDENLKVISVNVIIPENQEVKISEIWYYLNSNICPDVIGADKIFFNIRRKA